jgi:hypothetical protein
VATEGHSKEATTCSDRARVRGLRTRGLAARAHNQHLRGRANRFRRHFVRRRHLDTLEGAELECSIVRRRKLVSLASRRTVPFKQSTSVARPGPRSNSIEPGINAGFDTHRGFCFEFFSSLFQQPASRAALESTAIERRFHEKLAITSVAHRAIGANTTFDKMGANRRRYPA